MQIVIDIPEEEYNTGQLLQYFGCYSNKLDSVIYNGTPLPKNHGRLIDADELYEDFIDGTEGYDCNTWNRIEIGDIIENTPTIIEGSEG